MPRRRRSWNFWKHLLLGLLLAVVLFMGVLPLLETLLPWDPQTSRMLEWIRLRVMESLIAVWIFAFGSMVGSFINVVVWRMPRGVSVVTRGSACPHCTARIRLSDNVPIVGWLKLGGRCRVCRLPISARYPIVESIFGLAFLVVFLVTVATGGSNLPGGPRYEDAGIVSVVITTKWDIIAIYAFHMTLITLLITWSLMQLDGSRIPVKTLVFAWLVGLIAPALFPYLHPVKWLNQPLLEGWVWLDRFDTGFAGLAAGFLLGEFLEQMSSRDSRLPTPGYVRSGLMSVGLFLGWQALAATVLWFGLLLLVTRFVSWRPVNIVPPTGWLALATIVQTAGWRWIDDLVGGPGHAAWPFAVAAGVGSAMIITSGPANPRIENESPAASE